MSIEASAYHDDSVLTRELTRLFSKRLFVGTSHNYPAVDAYNSFRIGKKVVTVRRTADGVKAFGNVCLHRSNTIDPLGEGIRKFACGFHGWSYDAEGRLSFAPLVDKACIALQSLPRFPVAEAGGLLFAGLSGNEPDISKVEHALSTASITAAAPFHRTSLLHECNWKLLVENILESYHLNFVHRNTFLPSGFTSTSTHEWQRDEYINSASITPLPATSKIAAIRRLAKEASHSYKHLYIFPDLFISNTNDLIGFISHIRPVTATSTMLTWEQFELPQLTALAPAIRDHIRAESIGFATTTLEEDRRMVESCQIGMSSEFASFQLQPVEDRISGFHDYYNEQMADV